jgi:HD-GYP domain-containing protein (c-di-GMP phosphodiesterase class II)
VADAGMYVSKKAGGDRVSIAEDYGTDQTSTLQRQQVSGYVEGFLQRERTGPEQIDELVATLRKLSSGDEQKNIPLLRESIEALARAAESRELSSSGHGDAVAQYSEMIGRALGLTSDDIHLLGFMGRVHDVGKILIPEQILNKESALAEEEFHYMKMHPPLGAEIVACVPESELMQKAIECHHERVDGSGYPLGLKGDEISLWARILGVADAYVNLTSDRSLTPGKTSEQALIELEKSSGTKYDGMLVRVLARELKSERSLPGLS